MSILKRAVCLSLIVMALYAQSVFPHENDIEIIEGEEYVQTPFGLMLRECVQNVPSGTHVEEADDGSLHLTNDEQNYVRRIAKNDRCAKKNPNNLLKEWIDNGGYWLPNGLTLQKFEGNYKVPNTPATTNNQYLYYFIGSQNNDGSGPGLTIIQPVLAYHSGWYFQSWNCCPQGQAQNTTPVYGITPGDIVYGSVQVQNSVATIISQNKAGQQSKLSVAQANRNFNWIDATLEVYNIDSCSNFPTTYLEYSNMKVTLSNGSVVSPAWTNDYGASQCNGKVSIINSATIRIQHNVAVTEEA